ncbi:MAG: hypothetical protein FWF51_08480 [Chitinivibrionia bacterium]|nr:hypothetical protein [Chitinivibrionia bacterium]
MTNKIFILITFAVISVFSDTIYVNLDVDTSKITGSSKGLLSDKENIKTSAIINVLENNGNVLVGGNIFYEIQGDSIEITASGYPVKSARTRSTNDIRREFSPYLSVKQQISIPEEIWAFGGNIEVGGIIEKFFISADFCISMADVGGGMSWGKVISKRDFIKVVIGGSAGCWFIESDVFDGFGIVFGGFFVKTIFGTQKVKFEVSNRLLGPIFGIDYQLGLGFTFTPFVGK